MKKLLLVSLVLNVFFISTSGLIIYKKGGLSFLKAQVSNVVGKQTIEIESSPYYRHKVSIFESASHEKVDVAFIGDSMTDFGEWSELFPNFVVINRGIASDNTIGVLKRLDETIEKKPKKIFIMIGINDLNRIDSKATLSNYSNIINKLKSGLPDSSVYIQSVLPVNNRMYGSSIDNKDVKALNTELKKIAETEHVGFIDLYSALSNNDQLKEEYTIDGIHLTGAGYAVWKNQISQYITN